MATSLIKSFIKSSDDLLTGIKAVDSSAAKVAAKNIDEALTKIKNADTILSSTTASSWAKVNAKIAVKTQQAIIENTVKNLDQVTKEALTVGGKNVDDFASESVNLGKAISKEITYPKRIIAGGKKAVKPAAAAGISVAGIVGRNMSLVNGAEFSIISIENKTLTEDQIKSEDGPGIDNIAEGTEFLMITYANKALNRDKTLNLGSGDEVEIKNTAILTDTNRIPIYLTEDGPENSTFVIDKKLVKAKVEGQYTCGPAITITGTDGTTQTTTPSVSCGGTDAVIIAHTTLFNQFKNFPEALDNVGEDIKDISGDLLSTVGSTFNQAFSVVSYFLMALVFVYILSFIVSAIFKSIGRSSSGSSFGHNKTIPLLISTDSYSSFGHKKNKNKNRR